ncbi:unnamed protein product [Paramecium sonneborni]|uniref:Tetratricopeptide repeat protein n=1 Tax=Paramecium sonneborni TaxID=65129 RepID=A0A8S1RLA4_9CILI|nr:unnamed protein product [Paramecium sonneborni]
MSIQFQAFISIQIKILFLRQISNKDLQIIFILKKYLETIESFDQVLKNDNKSKIALIKNGQALLSLNRFTEALNCFDQVLELSPLNKQALLKKDDYQIIIVPANILVGLKKYSETENILSKRECLKQMHINDNYYKCNSIQMQFNVTMMLQIFRLILLKCYALIQLQQFVEAVKACDQVLALDSKHCLALFNKGNIYKLVYKYQLFHQITRYEIY